MAYDGTPFDGWQSQPSKNAIQDHLEKAFAKLLHSELRVHGAGRTDAGVHALGQRFHVDVPTGGIPVERWPFALNMALPPGIRITAVRVVNKEFHARFDAKGKVYQYRIWNDRFLHPFELNRSLFVPGDLSLEKLKECARLLEGTHDFWGLSANRGEAVESTVRTIRSVRVTRQGRAIMLRFEGEGFLYRMVRMLTGSMIRVASGRDDLAWLERILKRETNEKSRYCVPAIGLTLVKVLY